MLVVLLQPLASVKFIIFIMTSRHSPVRNGPQQSIVRFCHGMFVIFDISSCSRRFGSAIVVRHGTHDPTARVPFYLHVGTTVLIILLSDSLSPCPGGLHVQWQQLDQSVQSTIIHRHVISARLWSYSFQLFLSWFLNHIDFEQSAILDELQFRDPASCGRSRLWKVS